MKQGLQMGGRALSSYLVIMILNLLVGMGMGDNLYWLQILLNALLLAGMALMMWSDGGYRGERASTMSATVERLRAEGREPSPDMLDKVFMKKAVLIACLTAALPLVLLATVNLIVEPLYPPVIVKELTAEEQAALDQAMAEAMAKSMGAATEESTQAQDSAPAEQATGGEDNRINPVNVVARIVYMPIVSLYKLFGENPRGLNWVFLLLSVIYSIPEGLGYLMGPKLRRKKLEDIQKGKKRKMRNLKVNKKNKQPRQPKMEV